MYFSRDGRFVRTDIWREGKYLDLWSVPHFLSGISVALGLHILGFDFWAAVVIGFLLLVAYEMFEVIAKIEETQMNRVLDVVVGMTSLTPTLLFAPSFPLYEIVIAFVFVTTIDVTLSTMGWQASQKAAALEQSLREKIEKRKEQFRERRFALQKRFKKRKTGLP
jgi:hypothetical protein